MLSVLQASLIEYNLDVVDAAINALNAALARGLDWRELAALIESEKVDMLYIPFIPPSQRTASGHMIRGG